MFSARSLCCSMLGLYRVDIQVSIVFSARHASCSQLGLVFAARYVACSQLVGLYLFPSCVTMLLSPAFSKKSGGTLFLVFRGAWCVVRGS